MYDTKQQLKLMLNANKSLKTSYSIIKYNFAQWIQEEFSLSLTGAIKMCYYFRNMPKASGDF